MIPNFHIFLLIEKSLKNEVTDYKIIDDKFGYEIRRNSHIDDVRNEEFAPRVGNLTDKQLINLITKAYEKFDKHFPHGYIHIFHKGRKGYDDLAIFVSNKDKTIHIKTVLHHNRASPDNYYTKPFDSTILIEHYKNEQHYFIEVEL